MPEMNEEANEERIYTIPLSRAWSSHRRSPYAMRLIKSFIRRHMKVEDIIISGEVNEYLWSKGIKSPPRRIRIKAIRDNDIVTIYLVKGE